MCAKLKERQEAERLRRLGFSYSEIQQTVLASQASLSLWLRGVKLSTAQQSRLAEKKRAGNRAAAKKVRTLRLERVQGILKEAEREAYSRPQEHDHLWALGVALYWAEGTKPKPRASNRQERFELTNMDPAMILLVRKWAIECCGVSLSDFTYALYIHEGADVETARRFWCNRLEISRRQLNTYLKKPNPATRRYNSGRNYHGTIRLSVRRSTDLSHRIMCWIRVTGKRWGVV